LELGRDQATALRTTASPQGAEMLDKQKQQYEADIERYTRDEKELQDKAKSFEARYDALNYRDDQFDLSDASLSVSLAMLAVTALTRKRWLLWLSFVFAIFGAIMGTAGLFGLHLHPDWLSRLLS
jgi:hypothetical protein